MGRGTIGDDDGEEFAAGEADDADDFDESESSEEFAALDAIVDYDGECEREGEEASARRGDSVLREWRQWSRVWKWELARLGESRRGFEEGRAGGAWRR